METLYALAGMFPDGDLMDKNNLSGEPTPPEIEGSPVTAIEGFHLFPTIWKSFSMLFSVL